MPAGTPGRLTGVHATSRAVTWTERLSWPDPRAISNPSDKASAAKDFIVPPERADYTRAPSAHVVNNGGGEIGGGRGAAQIARQMFAFGVNALDSFLQTARGVTLAKMREHQDGGLHERGGVGLALAGDVRRGAVDGFEDGVVFAQV